ncbi:MAG: general secretion pathway protein GspK [Armatimonadetes bacterium]|nr:general secretion pathway protein GspK [Armatimonadota bacterium]MDE2207761.1 general secretion pathway protein GspK [Armatimonadota bacterium]
MRQPRFTPLKARGQALIPALFVTMILTVVAIAFATTATREVKSASNFQANNDAYYAARGAVDYAISSLESTSNNGATYGILQPDSSTDANGWMQIGNAWVKVDVIDTGAFIDLNSVSATTLAELPVLQQNQNLISAIVAWRTAAPAAGAAASSSSSSSTGATDPYASYYQTLQPPYQEAQAPYTTVDELLLVEGMTPDLLYTPISGNGGPAGGSMAQSSNGQPATTITRQVAAQGGAGASGGVSAPSSDTNFTDIFSQSTLCMANLFTTDQRELNQSANGTQRVDINTASAQTMESAGIPSATAEAIVRHRGGGGGGAPAGGAKGGAAGGGGAAATTNTYTTIADLLKVPGITPTVMQQIGDMVTTDTGQYRIDKVDVNTAPQEVLAMVPGMTRSLLDAIVQYRQSGQAFQSLGDLFALPSVGSQIGAVIGDLSTRSSTYLVRVKVRTAGSPRTTAYEAMVELRPEGAAILQWRAVGQNPGWTQWVPGPVLPQATIPASSSSGTGSASGSGSSAGGL